MVYAKAVLWRQKLPYCATDSTDPGGNGIRAGKGEYRGISRHNYAFRISNTVHILISPLRKFVISMNVFIHHTLLFVKQAARFKILGLRLKPRKGRAP
jgi:hypothetical protein